LSFREKKQNSNRAKGVEVLSVLAMVKNAKRVIFYPYCINGLKTYRYLLVGRLTIGRKHTYIYNTLNICSMVCAEVPNQRKNS
jgi:hypothetical protein